MRNNMYFVINKYDNLLFKENEYEKNASKN